MMDGVAGEKMRVTLKGEVLTEVELVGEDGPVVLSAGGEEGVTAAA
jgi:hypothetical protein